jgi:hypothetical protein
VDTSVLFMPAEHVILAVRCSKKGQISVLLVDVMAR